MSVALLPGGGVQGGEGAASKAWARGHGHPTGTAPGAGGVWGLRT